MDEAGSRKKLYSMSPLPEVEELNIKLTDLRIKKRDAIEADDFEKAAEFRDQEKGVLKELDKAIARGGVVDSSSSVIDEEEIAEVLAQWTGIPVHRLTEEETARLVNMEGRTPPSHNRPTRRHRRGQPGHPTHPGPG